MNNGTQNANRHVYRVIEDYSACVAMIQFAPAGLSLPVPAHLVRSCSTRSWAMNFARSDVLHAPQKPSFPAIHE